MLNIIVMASPLLIVTVGALVSEYAGRMALFLDGAINLGAFLCFMFTVKTSSPILGMLLAVIICAVIFALSSMFVESINANPFIASLALNLLSSSSVSLLSSLVFGTRGVLTSENFSFVPANARVWTTIVSLIATVAIAAFLKYTKCGLYIRITGSDEDVLKSRGVNVSYNRTIAWCIAAATAAASGAMLALRISSFVPNIASGRGWIALACIFVGKNRLPLVLASVIAFCLAQFAADRLPFLQAMPSPLLIALPYLITLVMIVAVPKGR